MSGGGPDPLLDRAQALVGALERGDADRAREILEQLADGRDSLLLEKIGRLTRRLHDALSGLGLESRMLSLAETDIPDAQARLEHVISVTEEAAHRTLGAVERTLLLSDTLHDHAAALGERLNGQAGDSAREESRAFAALVASHTGLIRQELSEVLMAQEFQDVTGQIIRRVIALVREVQDSLVELIRVSGGGASGGAARRPDPKLAGPAVAGLDQDRLDSQEDVDELLSSLGF